MDGFVEKWLRVEKDDDDGYERRQIHRLKPQGTARFSAQRDAVPPLVSLHISNS
jgi:hypothetical protein